MTELELQEAVDPSDLEELPQTVESFGEEILHAYYGEDFSEDQIESLLDNVREEEIEKILAGEDGYAEDEEIEDSILLYYENEDQLIGTSLFTFKEEEGELIAEGHFTYLREGYRRQGLGSRLSERGEEWAGKEGADRMKVEVVTTNEVSQKFVEDKLDGYERQETVPLTSFDGGEKVTYFKSV